MIDTIYGRLGGAAKREDRAIAICPRCLSPVKHKRSLDATGAPCTNTWHDEPAAQQIMQIGSDGQQVKEIEFELKNQIIDLHNTLVEWKENSENIIAQLRGDLAQMRERAEAAEKDAARYRWIRNNMHEPVPTAVENAQTIEEFEAAVDAAMKEKK